MRQIIILALLLGGSGCTQLASSQVEPFCNASWFEQLDKQLVSSDGRGHGPDLGSFEWRSTIEFKLGIRGQTNLPDKMSEQWCQYIDSLLN